MTGYTNAKCTEEHILPSMLGEVYMGGAVLILELHTLMKTLDE